MTKLYASDKIYINDSKTAIGERGVFAKKDIKKGEIIETCPVIEFSDDSSDPKQSDLVTYTFYFGENKDESTILLGFGSIYNHSYEPNSVYKQNDMTVNFIANRNIKKDEEILVNYLQGNKNVKTPLWFELKNSLL